MTDRSLEGTIDRFGERTGVAVSTTSDGWLVAYCSLTLSVLDRQI